MKNFLKKLAMIFAILVISNFIFTTIITVMEKFKVPEIKITAEKGIAQIGRAHV